jgi:hypothetical protein
VVTSLSRGFAHRHAGDIVRITTEHSPAVVGVVVEVDDRMLHVAPDTRRARDTSLAPGTHVRVVGADGRVEDAEVLCLDGPPSPIIAVSLRLLYEDAPGRRAQRRVGMRMVAAVVQYVEDRRRVSQPVRLVDLSLSGVRIHCQQPLPEKHGRVELTPSGWEGVEPLLLRVVWQRPLRHGTLAGASFVALSPEQKARIARQLFVRRYSG